MYRILIPSKPTLYRQMGYTEARQLILDCQRARLDWSNRFTLQGVHRFDSAGVGKPVVGLTSGTDSSWDSYAAFWEQMAEALRVRIRWSLDGSLGMFPQYPAPHTSAGYFTSDRGQGLAGVESTMMADTLYHAEAVHLVGAPPFGMLEGFFAVLGPTLGWGCTFIGDERYSGPQNNEPHDTFSHPISIEQTEAWWRLWNSYIAPQNTIQSVVGRWHKDELLLKTVADHGVDNLAYCDDASVAGQRCGNCWKCVSSAYILYAHGVLGSSALPRELTKAALDKALKEYTDYKGTGSDLFRSLGVLDRVHAATGLSFPAFCAAFYEHAR